VGQTAYLIVGGILLFAAASFFFAVSESALFALGKWRARQLADNPKGAIVIRLLKQPSELLATIVLGNTVANAAIIALGLWPAAAGYLPLPWTIVGLALLVLVGCEVLPKTLAVRSPERWALRVARPMLLIQELTGWFQRLVQRFNVWLITVAIPKSMKPQTVITDEEYQELIELAYQQGTLAKSEKEIILQIISLDRKTARDVMRPRSQMAALPDDLSVEEMMGAARNLKHHRLPLYDETPDTIVGILNARALLLDPQIDLAEAIEFPSFVPETMNLLSLLRSLERQQRGLAIVLNEFGATAGLVTIEDILEEVVGKVRADTGASRFIFEKLGPAKWRVSGTMSVDDFRREYPQMPDVPGVVTMGGVLVHLLEVVPQGGQSAVLGDLRLTAQAVDDRSVRELLVQGIKT
jgi:CBS domain containing-hemolysin-like protein